MVDTTPVESTMLIGLDLGQAADYTALSVLERIYQDGLAHYQLRHLERFNLGTPYPDQVQRVVAIIRSHKFQGKHPVLVVDQTGVGRPVVDLLRAERLPCTIIAISIHGGDAVSEDGNTFRIPKRELASVLQVLFQSKRLKAAKGLSGADTLIKELINFKAKISQEGHDSYSAWREGVHDDMVLSVALACWYGERRRSLADCEVMTCCPRDSLNGYDDGFQSRFSAEAVEDVNKGLPAVMTGRGGRFIGY